MVKAVFDNLNADKPKNHFTVGIKEDVTNSSLEFDPQFSVEAKETFRGKFYGLGADGTVGANKNSIKIIGEGTDYFAQGYFVYDSKKSGSMTISRLRFGPKEIKSTYLINRANFIACHQQVFLEKLDMLREAMEGSTFLLNTKVPKEQVWDSLPEKVQRDLIQKKMKFYIIDAYKVGDVTGMGVRINTIMQTCFFAISNILFDLEAGQTALLQARAAVHAFQTDSVNRHVNEGLTVATATVGRGHEALADLRFRRLGLGLSTGIIVLLIGGLALKIRQLEQRA